ncbi:hypothetical protein ABBQ38_010067 [Trebouxia sp. C0009 RCD-2024]
MTVAVLSPRECQRTSSLSEWLGASDKIAWPSIVGQLRSSLQAYGIDIVQPLCLSWYNEIVPESSGARISPRGASGNQTLVVLIGNSKNLWPSFLAACCQETGLLTDADPLDTYVEQGIRCATQTVPGHECRLFWSHLPSHELSGSKYVAIQRMAHAAGVAVLEQNSHLCVHPKYGPWIALRCALVFDGVRYTEPQTVPRMNPLSVSTQQYIQMAMRTALRKPSLNLEDAETSPKPCNAWLKWVAVRDAICPCHPWRYCEQQLEYHYTKDKSVLESAEARHCQQC